MRTAVFMIALALTDVARALGHIYSGNYDYLIWILIVFMIMDIIDFFRGREK